MGTKGRPWIFVSAIFEEIFVSAIFEEIFVSAIFEETFGSEIFEEIFLFAIFEVIFVTGIFGGTFGSAIFGEHLVLHYLRRHLQCLRKYLHLQFVGLSSFPSSPSLGLHVWSSLHGKVCRGRWL